MKPTFPGSSWGIIERTRFAEKSLDIEGWVVSEGERPLEGFRVHLGANELTRFELERDLASPDVHGVCWKLQSAASARFKLRAVLPEAASRAGDQLVRLVPIIDGRECDVIASVVEPSAPVPSSELLDAIGGGFTGVSFDFLGQFISKLGLRPSDHVLDVGCAVGRMAYGLSYYLAASGRYEGFDVSEPLIRWASTHLTPRHPNFRFRHVDLRNPRYNPRGRLEPADFQFPYPDASFDAVVLTSVFTHLRPSETRHYFDEIQRVLKPGGRCLATFFLLNSISQALAAMDASSLRFTHPIDDFVTANPGRPEDAIGLYEELVSRWLQASGLEPAATFYGTWCGRSGPGSYQDIVVVEKLGAARSRAARLPDSPHVVTCDAGGSVVVDATLFRLFEKIRSDPGSDTVTAWCREEALPSEVGGWARGTLEHAGLVATSSRPASEPAANARAEGALKVSVIILNRDGRPFLETLMPSIAEQSYGNVEVIVVDNGSQDDSVSWLRERWPSVEVLALAEDAGFSGANNRGVAAATGDAFFFLNNDTRLDPRAVERLVARLREQDRVGAVVPMVRLMAQPGFVNTLGNQIDAAGWARDSYIGHLDVGQLTAVRRVPCASFGAVMVPSAIYQEVGPLDEAYQYYYEDVDWSWRARLAGLELLAEPRAIVYHASGGTSGRRPWTHKLRLVARNRLRFAAKNLAGGKAARFVARYFVEDFGSGWRALRKGQRDVARAYLAAWWQFAGMLPRVLSRRLRAPSPRLVTDDAILAEMEELPHPRNRSDGPVLLMPYVTCDYGPHLEERGERTPVAERPRRRLLLIASSRPERFVRLAGALARQLDVTLAVPVESDVSSAGVELVRYAPGDAHLLRKLALSAEAVVMPIDLLDRFPILREAETPVVLDLSRSCVVETWAPALEAMPHWEAIHRRRLETTRNLLKFADFFICASERHRPFWLGMLFASGRLGPLMRQWDPSTRKLLDVVPDGITRALTEDRSVIPDPAPDIHPEDKIVVWVVSSAERDERDDAGCVLEAMAKLVKHEPRARLWLAGRPLDGVSDLTGRAEALGLRDRVAFMPLASPGAIPSLFARAHLALDTAGDDFVSPATFRPEFRQCLEAGLPIVVSGGGSMADLVHHFDLGASFPRGDVDGLSEALRALLALEDPRGAKREGFERLYRERNWERAAEPLARFCDDPRPAPDRGVHAALQSELDQASAHATPVRELPARAWKALRQEGLGSLVRRAAAHIKSRRAARPS